MSDVGGPDGATLAVPPRPTPVPAWRRPATYLQFVIGGVFGAAGVLTIKALMAHASGLEMALFAVAVFPAAWLHLLIHEAGHALAGWAGGQHVAAVGLGPWRVERGSGGWRVHKADHVQGIGGFALVVPRRETVSTLERSAYLLGGLLANLLAAAVVAALSASLGLDGGLGALFGLFALVGVVIGVVNLLPFQSGGWSSDGRQLLALWQGWPEARVAESMNRWAALAMLGVRPRDWPEARLAVDEAALPQAIADTLQRTRLLVAVDRGEARGPAALEAAQALVAGFWRGPDGLRQLNAGLLAAWQLKRGASPDAVEAWIAESEGGLLDQTAHRAWLRAAVALLRGDTPEALARLGAARAALPRVIDPASRAMLVEELALLSERLGVKDA